jgi:hypothetical protein
MTDSHPALHSVLEKKYQDPERPYSQKELSYIRQSNYRVLRLGKIRAQHAKCGHFYGVKHNGRKEKEIIQNGNNPDTGNCSVCWKFGKTPRHLRAEAKNLIAYFSGNFYEEPKYLTYDLVEGETDFYKWLYDEFSERA